MMKEDAFNPPGTHVVETSGDSGDVLISFPALAWWLKEGGLVWVNIGWTANTGGGAGGLGKPVTAIRGKVHGQGPWDIETAPKDGFDRVRIRAATPDEMTTYARWKDADYYESDLKRVVAMAMILDWMPGASLGDFILPD